MFPKCVVLLLALRCSRLAFTEASTTEQKKTLADKLEERTSLPESLSGPIRYIISTIHDKNAGSAVITYGNQPQSLSTSSSYTVSSTAAPYQTTSATANSQYLAKSAAASALLGSHCLGRLTPALYLSCCFQTEKLVCTCRTANSDCASINGSRCSNGVCGCASLTVPLGNYGCVPLATAFGDTCVITAQCRGLDPLASCYVSWEMQKCFFIY